MADQLYNIEPYTTPGTCADFVKSLFRGPTISSDGRYAKRALRRCLQNHALSWLIWEQVVNWPPIGTSADNNRGAPGSNALTRAIWADPKALETVVLQTIKSNPPYLYKTEKQRMAESSRMSQADPVDYKRVEMFVSRIKQWLAKRHGITLSKSDSGWHLLLDNIAANTYKKRAILQQAVVRGLISEITDNMLRPPPEDWGGEKRKAARAQTQRKLKLKLNQSKRTRSQNAGQTTYERKWLKMEQENDQRWQAWLAEQRKRASVTKCNT